MIDPARFVDTKQFPIDRPETDQFECMIKRIRAELTDDGCAVLKRFVKPEMLPDLVEEADEAAPNAHDSRNLTNVYFSQDDERLEMSHPRRRFYERSNAFIPADNFGSNSALGPSTSGIRSLILYVWHWMNPKKGSSVMRIRLRM